MSSFADIQHRPAMRRKSSAQNLLSSFKSNSNPPPVAPGLSNVTGLSFAAAAAGASTPTSTINPMSMSREWDAQSLHSDSLSGTTAASLAGTTSPQLGQGTSAEYLRDLVQKRIITLTYIRNVHEGRSHWFHTILISRADLDREFNNANLDVRKRTYRFAVLGMSLSSLLDINQPQDLLRGLMNTINEYDQNKDDGEKPKMNVQRASKRLFRPKNARRVGAGSFTEYAGPFVDTNSDPSYLMTLQIPFPLDYHQTLISLLDVISEVYNKILKILGPSHFAQAAHHMMGPLGLLSPHPGVSYLFSEPSNHPYSEGNPEGLSSSLLLVANPGGGPGIMYSGPMTRDNWSASLGDMVLKIDGKIKKITSTLLKELDAFARNGIKEELASLDPLLSTTGSGKSVYEEGA